MRARRLLSAAGIAASVLAVAARADACSCVSGGPPCQAFYMSDAVFVGRVASIDVRRVPLADGSFAVTVFDTQSVVVHASYRVSIEPFRQASADQRLTISGPPDPVRLVLVVR
jgi:hypothetical protein